MGFNNYDRLIGRDIYDLLYRIELRGSDDTVKTDLEVTCTDCGEHLCDAEHEDTMDVLVRVALSHDCPTGEPTATAPAGAMKFPED